MADGLIRRQRTEDRRLRSRAASPRVLVRATAFCLLSVVCPLVAEELPDPTRPPASLAAPGSAHRQLATTGPSAGLQSTIISKSRRAAIIDGKTVELGEKHGGARLVEVNEGSVVLRGAQTQRVLTLFPGVKITQKKTETRKKAAPESGVPPEEISTMPGKQGEELSPLPQKEEK